MVSDYTVYKNSAAQIVSHGLSGHPDAANIQFKELISEIGLNYVQQFHDRLTYMITALIFVILNITLSLFVYSTKCFDTLIPISNLIYIGTGASLGGFISISRKLKQMTFEKDIKSMWFIIYAIERIFISIFAGIIVYYAIRSNLVFGQINKLSSPIYGYILFATAAGFSETLVPNLLIRLEEKQK